MKDSNAVVVRPSAVVAMPAGMERRQINVAEFARSQDRKEPPKLRRSFSRQPSTASTNSLSRQTSTASVHSNKSPGRRRLSSSRDLVQEVYDRMGVNLVRGQSIHNSNGSFSDASKFSNSQASSMIHQMSGLAVDTRNENEERELCERKSCRSTRSVKSLMSAYGGGKSVASVKSSTSQRSFQDNASTTPSEGFQEKTIDCRDDGDMDGTMSVISVESHWTSRKNQQTFSTRSVMVQKTQSTMPKEATPRVDGSSISDSDDAIDRYIEEKIQEQIAKLNASWEEKFRQLEDETNRRIEKLEKELKVSSKSNNKMTYPYQNYRL